MRYARGVQLGLMWASALQIAPAFAQTGSIFTCTDAQGRHLSSDRLIVACLDREQRELGPGGVLRRVIAPTLSPEERLRAEERARAEAQVRARSNDERRLQQALLMRWQAPPSSRRLQGLPPVRAASQPSLLLLQLQATRVQPHRAHSHLPSSPPRWPSAHPHRRRPTHRRRQVTR